MNDAVLENGALRKLPLVCECQSEDYITGWLPDEPEGPQQLELFGAPLRWDRAFNREALTLLKGRHVHGVTIGPW